jgi:hypothetical protein
MNKIAAIRSSILYSSFFIITCCLSISCNKENLCDCLKSTGAIITEHRLLSDFTQVNVNKNVSVTLYQDTVNYADVEAGENLISLVKTDISNGVLNITNENTCNWVRSYKKEINVMLHFKNLVYVRNYASKDITCAKTIISPFIDAETYGSGDIHLSIQGTTSYTGLFANAGDIYMEGSVVKSLVFSQSFGFVYEQNLQSDSCAVDQRGTGDLYVSAKDWLRASISKEGNVYYTGNPVISSSFYGSGKLIHQ